MPANKNKPVTPIEATAHKDRRTNIPTEELHGFVADDENKPKTILYPRDPSLDPQLVWKGKDEQDSKDLAVPAVPIYIQEKIHPKYLIEDLRAQSSKEKPGQFNFFTSELHGLSQGYICTVLTVKCALGLLSRAKVQSMPIALPKPGDFSCRLFSEGNEISFRYPRIGLVRNDNRAHGIEDIKKNQP